MATPKAPPGGFQQGGWYEGRQYWNGSFSEPGQIHTQSDQQGAGQLVSKEVVQQTAPQNWDYLQQQRQQAQLPATRPATQAPQRTSQTSTGPGVQAPQQADINLPEMYKSLHQDSGVTELEGQYTQMEKEYIEAKGKINDNPFLSEATRVGREAKIEKLFQERTANIRGEIATKKADVETQLNLQMKQFDINSQQADRAWQQFNTLLSAGAFDNASGESVAEWTRATGISSDLIYSAVEANQKKNAKVAVEKFTNPTTGEVTMVTIDANTGNVINTQSLGEIGDRFKADSSSSTAAKGDYKQWVKEDAKTGITFDDLMSYYSGYLDPKEILQLYLSVNYYNNTPQEIEKAKKRYGI